MVYTLYMVIEFIHGAHLIRGNLSYTWLYTWYIPCTEYI